MDSPNERTIRSLLAMISTDNHRKRKCFLFPLEVNYSELIVLFFFF